MPIPSCCGPRGRCSSAFQWEADKVIIRKGLGERERERNNRFLLNSQLSLILFELAANFACLRRPSPLSQQSSALPTSNPCAQPVLLTPSPSPRLPASERGAKVEGEKLTRPLAPVITCGICFLFFVSFFISACLCETVLAWR